jgi:hypothetical protein
MRHLPRLLPRDLLPMVEHHLEVNRARLARQQHLVDSLEPHKQPVSDLAKQTLQALRGSQEQFEILASLLRNAGQLSHLSQLGGRRKRRRPAVTGALLQQRQLPLTAGSHPAVRSAVTVPLSSSPRAEHTDGSQRLTPCPSESPLAFAERSVTALEARCRHQEQILADLGRHHVPSAAMAAREVLEALNASLRLAQRALKQLRE